MLGYIILKLFQFLTLLQLDDTVQNKAAIEVLQKTEPSCQILLANWSEIEEINNILKIPLDATNDMQRNNLTMSDQFGCWLRMEWKIEDIIRTGKSKTDIAKFLHDGKFGIMRRYLLGSSIQI